MRGWHCGWLDGAVSVQQASVVVVGGGPGGYEAALVAAALQAQVTLVEAEGVGGACVLTDCVPSKALISTTSYLNRLEAAGAMGVRLATRDSGDVRLLGVDLDAVNGRIRNLATAQSRDIHQRLTDVGVQVVTGTAGLHPEGGVQLAPHQDRPAQRLPADMILLATGAEPRVMDSARPDGERILTWKQVWQLTEVPERLVVVGSGVTGAEFAQAFLGLGSHVVLVSSRERVLPGEDQDAAQVIEDVFRSQGMQVLNRSRMAGVQRHGDSVVVRLEDGRDITGTHALLAVGSVPRTRGLGLTEAGVRLGSGGHIEVDRVSRTSVPGVYAAGDCTGVLPLASVAAMQGRIAMWHVLGQAVHPLDLKMVSSNVFTEPEIATVGYSQAEVDAGQINAEAVLVPLRTNARAKMQGFDDGFVKIFCRRGTRIVVGGVVVAPHASELIHALTVAVDQRLTVDQLAGTFTVYPSLSGSIAEAARQLHITD